MSIKKNIFAPLAKGLGATRRAAVLLLVMMLTTTTAWALTTNGQCGEYLTWEFVGNTLTISGSGAMYDYDRNMNPAPWSSYAEQIREVVIENGVTNIGNYAFSECHALGSVTFADGSQLKSIGNYAFSSCNKLESVTFAEDSQLESIGDYAFQRCTNLTSITIPASVTSIGSYVFQNCDLASMAVADGNMIYDSRNGCNAIIETLTNKLIIGCKNSTIPAGVTSIGNYAFSYTGLTSIEIPASVTSIGNYAFSSCNKLESVTFAEDSQLESIGDYAFQRCTNLTSITIPASVTSIGSYVFQNCDLASMAVADGNMIYDSRNGCNAIIETLTNKLIIGCKNSTIPAGVTSIGNYAFSGTGLTSIEIPASVTSIGGRAFLNCSALATVTVYAPSCTLGEDAFANCNNLANIYVFSDLVDTYKAAENWSTYESKITEMPNPNGKCGDNVRWLLTGESTNYTLTISGTGQMMYYDSALGGDSKYHSTAPWSYLDSEIQKVIVEDGVTYIGSYAFAYCTALTSVSLPASVIALGDYVCYSSNGTRIDIPATGVVSLGTDGFDYTPAGLVIAVPAELLATYKTATNWSKYEAKMVGVLNETTGFDNTFATGNYEYSRTFNCGVAATLCLPFELNSAQISPYGKVYTFDGVDKTTEPTWTVVMREDDPSNLVSGNLAANTPYLFVPYILAGKSKGDAMTITFTGEVATAANAGYTSKAEGTAGAYWTFQGVYYNVAWNDGNANLGSVYGFAAQSHDGGSYTVNPGDFVKAAAGASIAPFRAFLQYTPAPSNAPRRGVADNEVLPSRMTVRLVNVDGDVTAIGTIDTKTGEIRFDSEAWYTLDGRRLDSKPAQKGVYINNGKKIIVK